MSTQNDSTWNAQLAAVRSAQGSPEVLQLKPSQLKSLLVPRIKHKKPVLIASSPGIGKTDIEKQAAQLAGAENIIFHPIVDDPTDYKGMPWVTKVGNGSKAEFVPFHNLERLMNADKLTAVFFDDLGQASPAVQAALMQVVLAREINGKRISDHVTFIAATNRRTDRAGVQGILEPLKSRFLCVQLRPDVTDWMKWAAKPRAGSLDVNGKVVTEGEGGGGINPYVRMYLGFRPDALCDFTPTADMTNSPCPRTWEMLSHDLDDCGVDRDSQVSVFSGYVGKGVAQELTAFMRMCDEIVQPDAILLNPQSAKIPEEPSVLYATAASLAARVEKGNVGRFCQYAERLIKAGKDEYAALAVTSALGRNPLLASTTAWVKAASGPIGQLIVGGDD